MKNLALLISQHGSLLFMIGVMVGITFSATIDVIETAITARMLERRFKEDREQSAAKESV